MKKLERTDYFFFALDKNWYFTFVSLKAGKVFNRAPGTLIGKNIWTEFSEAAGTASYSAYSKALAEQQFVYVEEYNSLLGWFENYIYPSPNGLSVYARDVTEKKRIERKLRQSQANLNATINNTEILIWSVDRELRLISFNKPFSQYTKKWYGVQLREGVNIIEQLLTRENVTRLGKWNECFNSVLLGATVIMEERNFGMDFEYSLSPIRDGNKIIGINVFAYNAVDRKAQERELAMANKQIGDLKLMALRSVMNPHFIFNILSSIQYYIIENDQTNAVNYLSAFSKLIRGVLNNSVNNTIRLADELEMLTLYVKLELMRFENKFDFRLQIDERMDSNTVELPSMLIQPFVENAIIHGLSHKPDRGTLIITIKKQDKRILFEIDDDGIGRNAAMNLRHENIAGHRSLGIAITEERLKLINAMDDVSFEIIDKEKEGKPAGTLVRIWLKG